MKDKSRFWKSLLLVPLVSGVALSAFAISPATTSAATFDPNILVSDAVFTAKDAMSVADIQNFLLSKNSVLTRVASTDLGDVSGRSAAQIIWDAAHETLTDFGSSAGFGVSNPLIVSINPQAIISTLQKEQSLITAPYVVGNTDTASALSHAMGYGCPDSGGCDPSYNGFVNQTKYAAAQLALDYYRAVNDPLHASYRIGVAYTLTNAIYQPYCPTTSTTVVVGNASTSALYRYTPHVCNGNANFWYYMNNWFGYLSFNPRLVVDSVTSAIYAVYNGTRYPIDTMDTFTALGFQVGSLVPVTVQDWALPAGPVIRRLITDLNGGVSYILDGVRHPIGSARIFNLRGFDWAGISPPNPVADAIPFGLPYYELAKRPDSDAVYIMTNAKGYAFPDAATFQDAWGMHWDEIVTTPVYTFQSFPLTNTVYRLAKGSGSAIYLMDGGRRLPIPSAAVFTQWGFDWNKITSVDDRFLGEFPADHNLTQLVKGSGPAVYSIQSGKKRPIGSAAALTRNGWKWADVLNVSDSLLNMLPTGATVN